MNAWREDLGAKLLGVRGRMAAAARGSGRDPGSVRLMAVTKTVPLERVQQALDLGVSLVGENRVQEAREKLPQLVGTLEPHLIGHLQGNKAGVALDLFECVQSLDSLDLARRLSRLAVERGRTLTVLWEVNTSGEPAKFGFTPESLAREAAGMACLPGLRSAGLMTLGPVPTSGRDPAPCFVDLRELRERLEQELGMTLPELSMGMSGDFETAIREGSTLVRIGSALFGPREA